tara:strand:- start:3037 stop:3426 length:390 start_codon:yes stop_codon:yes gene_type:complete
MPRKNTNTKTKNIKLVEEQENEVQQEVETQTEDTGPNRGEIIDVEWEEVQGLFMFKKRLEEMEAYFANMCLQYEKEKVSIMNQITYGHNDMYMMAQEIQKTKNIDENLTYELKLPTAEGEKAFFVRKDN